MHALRWDFYKMIVNFVEAIKEAHHWGSGPFLGKLFVTMLLSSSMNRPEHVWRKTWMYLSDGILFDQRLLEGDQGIIFVLYLWSLGQVFSYWYNSQSLLQYLAANICKQLYLSCA